MPYIKSDRRPDFDISNLKPEKAGELNYIISEICSKYIEGKGLGYTNCNEVVGVLECVKLEFYRRVTAPYEDEKIAENGDISYEKFN